MKPEAKKPKKVRMNRRMRRRVRRDEDIAHYFFEGGNPKRPRTELVHRDELWGFLDWYDTKARRANNPLRVLWRFLTRQPMAVLKPFTFWRLQAERAEQEREEEARNG